MYPSSFPFAAQYLTQRLTNEQIESLRPHINTILYSRNLRRPSVGIERLPKYTEIVASIRIVAQYCARKSSDLVVYPQNELGESDRLFFDALVSSLPVGTRVRVSQLADPVWKPAPEGDSGIAEASISLANRDPWRALSALEETAGGATVRTVDADLIRARALVSLNRPRSALWTLESLESNNVDEQINILYERAIIWQRHLPAHLRNAARARSLMAEALRIARSGHAQSDSLAIALNGSALTLMKDDPEKALKLELEALECLSNELSNDPSGVSGVDVLHSNIARLYRNQGDFVGALRHIDAAIAVGGPYRAYLDIRWHLLLELGRNAEATLTYEQLRVSTNDVDALVSAANFAQRMGDSEGAIECYRRALDIEPWLNEVRITLVETLMSSGDYESARANLRSFDEFGMNQQIMARRDLAQLECESQNWSHDVVAAKLKERLTHLLGKYPDDLLVRESIQLVDQEACESGSDR